jgi:hypothetical protein
MASIEFSLRHCCYVYFYPILASETFPHSATLTRSNQRETSEMCNCHCRLALIEEPVANFDAPLCQSSIVIITEGVPRVTFGVKFSVLQRKLRV